MWLEWRKRCNVNVWVCVAKVVNNRREADEEGWVYLLNERFFKFLCVFVGCCVEVFYSADNNRLIYKTFYWLSKSIFSSRDLVLSLAFACTLCFINFIVINFFCFASLFTFYIYQPFNLIDHSCCFFYQFRRNFDREHVTSSFDILFPLACIYTQTTKMASHTRRSL